jgi:hypothetical protein
VIFGEIPYLAPAVGVLDRKPTKGSTRTR